MQFSRRSGFTLIEILIVVAIIAVIMSVAVPRLMGARLSANEHAAASTLRAIATSQAQVRNTPVIDSNGDGVAEYGYFGELTGTAPTRISAGGLPAPGMVGRDELTPSQLLVTLGKVQNGVVTRSGYMFQIHLPGAAVAGIVPGIAEDPNGGKVAGFPDPENGSLYWCAYAWPLQVGQTGNIALFVSHEGVVLQTNNRGAPRYGGLGNSPAFDAAGSVPGDMSSRPAYAVPANDGNTWVPVE